MSGLLHCTCCTRYSSPMRICPVVSSILTWRLEERGFLVERGEIFLLSKNYSFRVAPIDFPLVLSQSTYKNYWFTFLFFHNGFCRKYVVVVNFTTVSIGRLSLFNKARVIFVPRKSRQSDNLSILWLLKRLKRHFMPFA